jgi:formylglycine-generating enzyme required for sulfatase activity
MYAKCVEAGQCVPPDTSSFHYFDSSRYAKHPVGNMDWRMAKAYCSWVGRRLPTEAEWEKAARGTEVFTYPWGEGIDCDKANYEGSCVGETSPVGSYEKGKSAYGAYDMAGNVSEWVNDWYGETYYQSSPASNPSGPDSGDYRVLRGGAWYGSDFKARSAARFKSVPNYAYILFGFRCARSNP